MAGALMYAASARLPPPDDDAGWSTSTSMRWMPSCSLLAARLPNSAQRSSASSEVTTFDNGFPSQSNSDIAAATTFADPESKPRLPSLRHVLNLPAVTSSEEVLPQSESSSATLTGRPRLSSPENPALSHLSHMHLSPKNARLRGESLASYRDISSDPDVYTGSEQSSTTKSGSQDIHGHLYPLALERTVGRYGPAAMSVGGERREASPIRHTAYRSLVYGTSAGQDTMERGIQEHTYPNVYAHNPTGSFRRHEHIWRDPAALGQAQLSQTASRKIKRHFGAAASFDLDGSNSKRSRKTHKAALTYSTSDVDIATADTSKAARTGFAIMPDTSAWDSAEFHEAALGLASIKAASDLRVDIPAALRHKQSTISNATNSTLRSDRPPLLAFSSQSDEAVQPADGSNGSAQSIIMDNDDHNSGESIDEAASPTGTGRYQCDTCHKRFTRPSALAVHTHMHTGAKPFTCPVCQRAFSVNSNLRRHLRTHSKTDVTDSAKSAAVDATAGEAAAGSAIIT